MNNQEIKERVIYLLSTLPVCKVNNGETQYTVRCPYCGDSSNPSHGHLSIKINKDDNSEMLYRCFKCDSSGLLGVNLLEDLGLSFDSDMRSELKRFNRNIVTKSNGYSTGFNNYILPISVEDNRSNRMKLDYFNHRLGLALSYDDVCKDKIILDFNQFLDLNGIDRIQSLDDRSFHTIQKYYLGFLSKNNNLLTFRNITNIGRRYMKVKLDYSNVNPDTFYVVPKTTDILYTNPIRINIAEGTFDILSVKYNLREDYDNEEYYVAICGSSYASTIRCLIMSGLNTGINIHIYSDNDKSDSFYVRNIINNPSIIPWIDSISIHRNMYPGEKDFGIPRDRINDKSMVLYTSSVR